MHIPVGIRSLTVSFPSEIRTNDYYIEKYPELVANAEAKNLARLMSLSESDPRNKYELEMIPYLKDPFRGTVQRRILGPGESSLTLEYRAAKDALEAAKLSVNDIDLIIVSSFLPDQLGFGNAAYLANELGLKCGAWNLDASCGSVPIALQTASSLVQTGIYRNVLVVVSCTYSRLVDEDDTLSWFLGDGGGAFVISSLEANQGILGTKTTNTGFFCDKLSVNMAQDKEGNQKLHLLIARDMNKAFGEAATEVFRTCCEGALTSAGISLDDIDFFVFATPTAWYLDFCIKILKVKPERTINLYPQYANIGGTLTLANLYHAAHMGKIRENDLVLLYGFGGNSSAAAIVMRWGDVALGPFPLM